MKYFNYIVFLCVSLLNLNHNAWAMASEDASFKETETHNYRRLHFEKVDSTQKHARRIFDSVEKDKWYIVSTEEQTDGVGQFSRIWASPPLVNIYVTYIVPWISDSYSNVNLYQVSAASISQTLETLGFTPTIKWANDIRLNEKKVAGILCETFSGTEGDTTLIGIGLNVNMPIEDCEQLDQPVTSLSIESGQHYDKEKVLDLLTNNIIDNIEKLKTSGFASFYPYFEERLSYIGAKINLETPGGIRKGTFMGINKNGFMKFIEEGSEKIQIVLFGRIIIDKK
jgi:BirA family biotin operon repressor/biotin-[acetyl-CoA-carboxylase] ligase